MKSSGNLKRNYLYNLFYQILTMLVPLVTTPYVTRVLGPEKLGEYSYTYGIVSYFGIVAVLGTVTYAQREIAAVQKEPEKRIRLFYEILCLRLGMVLLVGVIYVIFFQSINQYKLLYRIQLLTVFSWAADISWFFQGMEDFRVTVIRNSIIKLVSVALIFILVHSPKDLWIYTAILSGSTCLGNLLLWPFLHFYLGPHPKLKTLHPLRHLKGSLELFVAVLSVQILTVMDQTMLGFLTGTEQVGYYSQAVKMINVGSSFLVAFTSALMPRLTVILQEGDWDLVGEYYEKTVGFAMMIDLPMTFGLILVAKDLVPVFLGEQFSPSIPILQLLSPIFITQIVGQVLGSLLIAMKRYGQHTASVTFGAIVNFISNLIGIRFLGAKGAAIASVISECCIGISMIYWIHRNFKSDVIGKKFLHYLPYTIGMSLVVIMLGRIIPSGLPSLLCLPLAGIAVYFILLYWKKDEQFCSIIHRRRHS